MSAVSRRLFRVAAIGSLVVGILLATASPAAAHGVGGVSPTNYTTRITSVTPTIDWLDSPLGRPRAALRVDEHGRARRGRARTTDGEPYLRVGPRGVFENSHSPATYLNRSFTPTRRAPTMADPAAPPAWTAPAPATPCDGTTIGRTTWASTTHRSCSETEAIGTWSNRGRSTCAGDRQPSSRR